MTTLLVTPPATELPAGRRKGLCVVGTSERVALTPIDTTVRHVARQRPSAPWVKCRASAA